MKIDKVSQQNPCYCFFTGQLLTTILLLFVLMNSFSTLTELEASSAREKDNTSYQDRPAKDGTTNDFPRNANLQKQNKKNEKWPRIINRVSETVYFEDGLSLNQAKTLAFTAAKVSAIGQACGNNIQSSMEEVDFKVVDMVRKAQVFGTLGKFQRADVYEKDSHYTVTLTNVEIFPPRPPEPVNYLILFPPDSTVATTRVVEKITETAIAGGFHRYNSRSSNNLSNGLNNQHILVRVKYTKKPTVNKIRRFYDAGATIQIEFIRMLNNGAFSTYATKEFKLRNQANKRESALEGMARKKTLLKITRFVKNILSHIKESATIELPKQDCEAQHTLTFTGGNFADYINIYKSLKHSPCTVVKKSYNTAEFTLQVRVKNEIELLEYIEAHINSFEIMGQTSKDIKLKKRGLVTNGRRQ